MKKGITNVNDFFSTHDINDIIISSVSVSKEVVNTNYGTTLNRTNVNTDFQAAMNMENVSKIFNSNVPETWVHDNDLITLVSLDNIQYFNDADIRTSVKRYIVGYKPKKKTIKTESPFSKLVSKLEKEVFTDTDKDTILYDMINVCKVSVTSVFKRLYMVNSDNVNVRNMYNESYVGTYESNDDLPLFMTGLTSDHFQHAFITLYEMMLKAIDENNPTWLSEKMDFDVTNKRVFVSDLSDIEVKTKTKALTGIQYLYNQIRKNISAVDTFRTCENRYTYIIVSLDNDNNDNCDYINSEIENHVYKRLTYHVNDNYTDTTLNKYAENLYNKLVNTDTQKKCIVKRLQNPTLGYKAIANSTGLSIGTVKSCFRVLKDKAIKNGIDKEVHAHLKANQNDSLFTGNGLIKKWSKHYKVNKGTIKLYRDKDAVKAKYAFKAISKRKPIDARKAINTIDAVFYAMSKHYNDSIVTTSMLYSKSDFVGVFTYDIYKQFVKRFEVVDAVSTAIGKGIDADSIKYKLAYKYYSDKYDSMHGKSKVNNFVTSVFTDKDIETIQAHIYKPINYNWMPVYVPCYTSDIHFTNCNDSIDVTASMRKAYKAHMKRLKADSIAYNADIVVPSLYIGIPYTYTRLHVNKKAIVFYQCLLALKNHIDAHINRVIN